MHSNNTISSFWYSLGDFSINEILCVASYIANGNQFILYAYNKEDDSIHFLKDCISHCKNSHLFEVRDSSEVVSKDKLYFDTDGKVASFSDYFRYSLLRKFGGWWVDMDTICIRDFRTITDELIFCSGRIKDQPTKHKIENCVIKANKGNEIFNSMATLAINAIDNYYKDKDRKKDKVWRGVIGPDFLTQFVLDNNLSSYVAFPNVFHEIGWWEVEKLIAPYAAVDFSNAFCFHIANSMWGWAKLPKNYTYPNGSIIEYFKKKYIPAKVRKRFKDEEVDFYEILDRRIKNKETYFYSE